VVACFLLQHPTSPTAPASGGDVQWTIVHRYLTGGQPAVDAFVARARSRNSHRRGGPAGPARFTGPQDPELPDVTPPRRYGTTIADVAVDGSFPADGHEDRVRAWAHSTVTAWTAAR
jgi:hypothetical protein